MRPHVHQPIRWDEYRIEHIALHDVDPDEVWQACEDRLHRAHREGRNRYRLYGQTESGRYLFVVLGHIESSRYKPITDREMTLAEKGNFRRLKR